MTIYPGAFAEIRYTFLPFQIEFRILPVPSTVLVLKDARNHPLVHISLNEKGLLILSAESIPQEQVSNPGFNIIASAYQHYDMSIYFGLFSFLLHLIVVALC